MGDIFRDQFWFLTSHNLTLLTFIWFDQVYFEAICCQKWSSNAKSSVERVWPFRQTSAKMLDLFVFVFWFQFLLEFRIVQVSDFRLNGVINLCKMWEERVHRGLILKLLVFVFDIQFGWPCISGFDFDSWHAFLDQWPCIKIANFVENWQA